MTAMISKGYVNLARLWCLSAGLETWSLDSIDTEPRNCQKHRAELPQLVSFGDKIEGPGGAIPCVIMFKLLQIGSSMETTPPILNHWEKDHWEILLGLSG